ncbi:TIGR04063 family PEP-CTERM/XrtA system glycosyltransferase [Duganella aceris]|uniref:Glycosyltransferase, exosortase A system-associated n=1 Tax=Duganella aceris TaxID=2703883 RepID=A0ABX0FR20_9BURK|nr:TIGR04063 family PEP-CTERM/XrtA system glycosyltransferase [Duganella aceris]NGZ87100.1 glycosyltransferase, exosortase A system-associated [Duganella aceris]
MRILHILDHSLPLHSGYSFRTLAILRQQRKLGWDTLHLTSAKQGAQVPEQEVDGWHFFRTPPLDCWWDRLPLMRHVGVIDGLARRLGQIARASRPHILHAHSPALNALAALRVGNALGIPVVYEIRAFWEDAAADHGTGRAGGPRYRLSRAIESYALRRADAVTTICEGLRGDIVARGIPGHKVTVIPNAVDIRQFADAGPPDGVLAHELGLTGRLVLGFIGSFYAYEGLALLIRALPRMLAAVPSLQLLLVGGGPQEQELRTLVTALQLQRKVTFAGRVPQQQIPRYYGLVDILVYPRLPMRLTELVTPLKPLEGMAYGRLVIASDVGGHRELIRHRKTGMLFEAGNLDALADQIIHLIRQVETWPQLRRQARAYVAAERDWGASVARYRDIYQRLLAPAP